MYELCFLIFLDYLDFLDLHNCFHGIEGLVILFSDISFSTFELVKRMAAALLPLPFLQKSASVLRKIFFVLHSKMIQEGLFRHEVFIVDVIFLIVGGDLK